MPTIAGVDGSRGGWLCITKNLNNDVLDWQLFTDWTNFANQLPRPDIITVDMPIGLTDAGPRLCDRESRQLLGEPRRRSVFPAPIRPALHANTRQQADAITRGADGRGVGAQSWGIFPKVCDLDQVIRANAQMQGFVREVHPEVCFWAWNGQTAMTHSKKTAQGKQQRLALVHAFFGPAAFNQVRAGFAIIK